MFPRTEAPVKNPKVSKGPLPSMALNSPNYITDTAVVTELTETQQKHPQYMQSVGVFPAGQMGILTNHEGDIIWDLSQDHFPFFLE